MNFRSPLVLMSTVGLIILGFLASPGANKAVADPSGDRLGCGTYCQSAGGYGAAGGPKPPAAVTLANTGTTIDADGYAPVTLTCHRPVQCVGVLILGPKYGTGAVGDGRSDLLVNADATRTIAVPMGTDAIAYLRSHGPTTYSLLIDASKLPGGGSVLVGASGADQWGFDPTTLSNDLTVAAPG